MSNDERPTQSQFEAYDGMFQWFSRTLFGGELRPVILNFSRRAKTLGFFAPERWQRAKGKGTTHEISLNPAFLKTRPTRDTASTLVHEMTHLWQFEAGTPSRGGYHNAEWADKMESIGLMPSDTGQPGGKRVGPRMTHYIVDGGPFDRAFKQMPAGYLLPWQSWEPTDPAKGKGAPVSKLKYTCPDCATNVWGKPGLNLCCLDCKTALKPAA